MVHSTFRGCTIWRNTQPGYQLRYTALTPSGHVAADTLAGIRELIRDRT
jgi:hypothetical protein